jgi:dihydroorotate dehydrogenase electron transfer subunit
MLDSRTLVSRPRPIRVKEVLAEKGSVRSIFFQDDMCVSASPGNFVMVWLPGIEEIPMNISRMGDVCSITVWPYGPGTTALCSMKNGDTIWLRGPYGNPYSIIGEDSLLVGSGGGLSPLLGLAKRIKAKKLSATFVLHAKSKDGLIFYEELSKICRVVAVTSDGSEGVQSKASEVAVKLIKEGKFDSIYAGLNEIELRSIFDAAEAKRIPVQFGLERSMLCGIGLCGSCSIDKYLVCKDGPILKTEQLRECMAELGVFRRNKSGAIVEAKEY